MAEADRKHQAEIERLKNEINQLNDKHLAELEDEREAYQKNMLSIKQGEDELRDNLLRLEKQLADTLNLQSEYEKEKREYDDRLTSLVTSNQKLKEDLEDARTANEQELQKWKSDAYAARSELRSLETALSALKSQMQTSSERIDQLNKTINDHVSKIRDLTGQLSKLEQELNDARLNANAKEVELDSALNRIRVLEEQILQLQTENAQTRNEFNDLTRTHDSVKLTKDNLEKEVEKLRQRTRELEATLKETRNSNEHLKSEHQRLQNILRYCCCWNFLKLNCFFSEKSKQTDNLQQVTSQFENRISKLRKDLQDTSDKVKTSFFD